MRIKKIIFPILIVFFFIAILIKYYTTYRLSVEGKYVNAVVIDYFHSSKTNYVLKYKFTVSNKTYISQAITRFFKCDNGKKGCVGEVFEVYYLPSNPKINDIDLKNYEIYRNKIFLFGKPSRVNGTE